MYRFKDGKYTDDICMLYEDLLAANVSCGNIEKVISLVLERLAKYEPDSVGGGKHFGSGRRDYCKSFKKNVRSPRCAPQVCDQFTAFYFSANWIISWLERETESLLMTH